MKYNSIPIHQMPMVQRFFVRKKGQCKNGWFNIVEPGNFSTLHFYYDNKKYALNVLYGPNVDSPSFYKDVIF